MDKARIFILDCKKVQREMPFPTEDMQVRVLEGCVYLSRLTFS